MLLTSENLIRQVQGIGRLMGEKPVIFKQAGQWACAGKGLRANESTISGAYNFWLQKVVAAEKNKPNRGLI